MLNLLYVIMAVFSAPSDDYIRIRLDAIREIESQGRLYVISNKGARGPYQIMEPTWRECTQLMSKRWPYQDSTNLVKSQAVADFYVNRRIQMMLRHFRIPITTASVLASYNTGVGNVRRLHSSFGSKWAEHLPEETKRYIVKYNRLIQVK